MLEFEHWRILSYVLYIIIKHIAFCINYGKCIDAKKITVTFLRRSYYTCSAKRLFWEISWGSWENVPVRVPFEKLLTSSLTKKTPSLLVLKDICKISPNSKFFMAGSFWCYLETQQLPWILLKAPYRYCY